MVHLNALAGAAQANELRVRAVNFTRRRLVTRSYCRGQLSKLELTDMSVSVHRQRTAMQPLPKLHGLQGTLCLRGIQLYALPTTP